MGSLEAGEEHMVIGQAVEPDLFEAGGVSVRQEVVALEVVEVENADVLADMLEVDRMEVPHC